jgi:lipopolysaccharide biosynthesis regulator YciM
VSYVSALGGIYNNMAVVALESADYPRAESFVRKAIEHQDVARSKNPEDTQVLLYLRNHHLQLARIKRETDLPEEAVEAYSKAVACAEQAVDVSDDANLRKTWAEVMCELSRYLAHPESGQERDLSRSVQLLEKACKINPEATVMQYTRGCIAFHKSDWDQAIQHFSTVIGDDQFHTDFRGFSAVYTAMAHAQKGEVELAKSQLLTATKIIEQVELAKVRDELQAIQQEVEMLLQAKPGSEPPDNKKESPSTESN